MRQDPQPGGIVIDIIIDMPYQIHHVGDPVPGFALYPGLRRTSPWAIATPLRLIRKYFRPLNDHNI